MAGNAERCSKVQLTTQPWGSTGTPSEKSATEASVVGATICKHRESRHTFKTHSDTETIVHLYEEEGEKFAEKLEGMFGIALWDTRKKMLVLARDRFGEKPLYYGAWPGVFAFGSEIKAVLAHPAAGRSFQDDVRLATLRHFSRSART